LGTAVLTNLWAWVPTTSGGADALVIFGPDLLIRRVFDELHGVIETRLSVAHLTEEMMRLHTEKIADLPVQL
jgi:hypothetical protein